MGMNQEVIRNKMVPLVHDKIIYRFSVVRQPSFNFTQVFSNEAMPSIPQNRILSRLNKNLLSTPAIWYLILSVFSLIGTLIILYSTVCGAALSDDSYFYISSGRNLLSGNGFDLSSKVPPALPLLLSLIGLFKVDPLSSIRWLNAIVVWI